MAAKVVSTDIINSYSDVAVRASARFGVPSNIILSVINKESTGDTKASATNEQSGAAQIGLMQIGSAALIDVQSAYGDQLVIVNGTSKKISDLTMSDMTNAEANVMCSTAYIKVCAERYTDGTMSAALNRYGDTKSTYASDVIESANNIDEKSYKTAVTDIGGDSTSASTYKKVKDTTPTSAGGTSPKYVAGTASGGGPVNVSAIMNFAKFSQTKAFLDKMRNMFTQSGMSTLHSYLADFMAKFYHTLYYIPTLPDNFAILVKPECCFIEAPACNVIYPTLKTDISYARDAKSEPTRIVSVSNPVSNVFGVAGTAITNLITMAFMDYSNGKTIVSSVNAMNVAYGLSRDLKHPQNNLTLFEAQNGIRILHDSRGEDLYLFLASNGDDGTAGSTKEKANPHWVLTKAGDALEICKTLERLAQYSLLRARYEGRQGSATMVSNPYIVPGFPMLSVEGSGDSSMNLYAYVTSVTQSISDSVWTTTVGFNNVHVEAEARPSAFPIAEDEYTATIDATYKRMLGNAMTKVDNTTGADTCRAAYNASDKSVTSMLKRIWRPLTTMQQHLDGICDGASIVEMEHLTYFKNAEGKGFFREDIQAQVRAYTEKIMKGTAMTTTDVR